MEKIILDRYTGNDVFVLGAVLEGLVKNCNEMIDKIKELDDELILLRKTTE